MGGVPLSHTVDRNAGCFNIFAVNVFEVEASLTYVVARVARQFEIFCCHVSNDLYHSARRLDFRLSSKHHFGTYINSGMSLSEKAKGKQREIQPRPAAEDPVAQLDPVKQTRELVIRFTEGIPDLVITVSDTDAVRDVKRKVSR